MIETLIPAWLRSADAACADPGLDPELWFGDQPSAHVRAVCATCPYQEQCRDWGLRNERYGMWGGLVEEERQQVRRLLRIPGPPWVSPDWEQLDTDTDAKEVA